MTLDFVKTIQQALTAIGFSGYYELPVYEAEELRSYIISDEVIEKYGQAKWAVVDILNEKWGAILFNKFDLYHWLEKNKNDEVAFFLNEAGSNSLNYSQYLAPFGFHI